MYRARPAEKGGAGARSECVHMLILEGDELKIAVRCLADSSEMFHAIHVWGPGRHAHLARPLKSSSQAPGRRAHLARQMKSSRWGSAPATSGGGFCGGEVGSLW